MVYLDAVGEQALGHGPGAGRIPGFAEHVPGDRVLGCELRGILAEPAAVVDEFGAQRSGEGRVARLRQPPGLELARGEHGRVEVEDLPRVFLEALEDRSPRPGRVWNRIPDDARGRIVKLALDEPELSPRELAVRFTDGEGYFVSEASVYRLLKAHDLITSPAFIVIKAADEFWTSPEKVESTC